MSFEFAMWHQQIKKKTSKNAIVPLISSNEDIFSSVHRFLLILITLSAVIARSNRSFSILRDLKIYLRNTTGENRLNCLWTIMNINTDLWIFIEEIINKLAIKNHHVKLLKTYKC